MLEALLKPIDPNEIFVLELSSYQLDDLEFSPNIAVVLNLFPEHMNYHGSLKNYYEAKKNIINFQKTADFFIYNAQDKNLKKWAKTACAQLIPFNDPTSPFKIPIQKILEGTKIPLIGQHNQANIKAALTVANFLKLPEKKIQKALETFEPLPHRLQFVGEYKGIKFYDDAISTTPESTIMAIKALKNVGTILLGGEDRGYEFSQLEITLKKYKIKNLVLFPETGKRMIKAKKSFNILETFSMEEALKFAYKNSPKGSICLLSTASPSYSLWKNFEEKGDQFQFFVKQHAHHKKGKAKNRK
jgi:UDP-N-acetylmuramoylalanine--D-glutamate ligase